jgi:starch synthase
MRYGTIPVVRATGGLDDTVDNFDESSGTGNGFKFHAYNPQALLEKIREALYFYGRPNTWQLIQRNGMSLDFSWDAAAKKYLQLYDRIVTL